MEQGARQFRLGFSDNCAALAQRLKSKGHAVSPQGFNAVTQAPTLGCQGADNPKPNSERRHPNEQRLN